MVEGEALEGVNGEQVELSPALARARESAAAATARTTEKERAGATPVPAPTVPIARVLVDVPPAHLDRPFDYLVPASMHESVLPGTRVKVRFAGRDVSGFVLDRVAESGHPGPLTPLRRAVSAEPVLTAEIATLVESVAARYAGTRADVLRLAVPPRHAAAERRPTPPAPRAEPDEAAAAAWWRRYAGGAAMTEALRRGGSPRSVWTALPGEDWATGLAHAAATALACGRGVVLCVPHRRDVDRLDAALRKVLGADRHVLLTADLGPAARYRSFLAVCRGAVQVVAGTRAAAFAPVRDLGLVAIWDDGDDLYAEPRAPYPHAREVLLLRAHQTGCAALVGAVSRSVESVSLLSSGWAQEVRAPREEVRRRAPLVSITGATDRELERDPAARSARLPRSAHAAIRAALVRGPVLVQTPRTGYAGALHCDSCREPARCPVCAGPLRLPRPQVPPSCGWCGREAPDRPCPECGRHGLRAAVVGERRTAEELGRAFPSVPVRRSSGERFLRDVGPEPAIVVATPGAEPQPFDGYAAVLLLDTWLMLSRPNLRTAEEAVRRWFNAAALARPATEGGRVVAVGEPGDPALQSLVRWDATGFAEREAAERRSAHLPPASRLAVLTGSEEAVQSAVARLELPRGAELLGPVPVRPPPGGPRPPGAEELTARVVIRVPRHAGAVLSQALVLMQGHRSAHKLPAVRVQVDPYEIE